MLCFTTRLSLFLLLIGVSYAGFYDSSSHVFELTASNFHDVVYNTNYTTIVEFYAPWCGHCQNLKPIYKKVGIASDGIFQTAALNCDDLGNKPLCSQMQIKGFPTLLVFRPPKYDPNDAEKNTGKTRHASETYNGERTLSSIVDFVTSRIKNYVKRVSNEQLLTKFVNGKTKTNKNKVLLLTEKNKPTSLIKSLAIDFMTDLEFAYATISKSNKESFLTALGLDKDSTFPKLVVINKSTEKDEINVYEGKFDKYSLSSYLSSYGTPLEGPLSLREKLIKKYKKPEKKSKKKDTKKDKTKAGHKKSSRVKGRDEL